MSACTHDLIEWEQQDQEMHAQGWVCTWCNEVQIAEYHHQLCCRRDYCGAGPVLGGAVVPSPEPVLR